MDGLDAQVSDMVKVILQQGGSTLVFAVFMWILASWIVPKIIDSTERKQTQMLEAFKEQLALERAGIKEVSDRVAALDQHVRSNRCHYPSDNKLNVQT